ncbi:MAG: hypothetical protein ACI8P3_001634 [Saprospiraceae bacterium]|jgi:hypothetical protein
MKILFTSISLIFFSLNFLQAQILFQEDFEGGSIPTGWTIQSNASDGGWMVGTSASISSQFFPIPSNGSSGIAGTNDDACNCNKSNEYFITPALDLSNETTVVMRFDAYFLDNTYQGNPEDATIEISTDSINWEVVEDLHGHGSWDTHSINLSDYAGNSTVYIGFRYDDGTGWLYGFAIDNVVVEVPPILEAEMVSITSRIFGEVGTALPIKGTVFNAGVTTLNAIEIGYTINGGGIVSSVIDNVDIPSFTYYDFETSAPWIPAASGIYTVDVEIITVNNVTDENLTNNSGSFDPEIFEQVIVPNKINEFLASDPIVDEISVNSSFLNKPTDLDFFPILGKNELWVINQRSENDGGSTLTISDATLESPSDFDHRIDGNSWHFMSLPTAIAFSDDNFNFANSPGVQDANHSGGTFTGPALWSSDPDIYAQPSGGNGSHLDMLHGSPFSMGIAHEVENVFWVYDDWNKDIVRYDFAEDHGPGNDDHSDAIVRRYKNIGIDADGDIPNHMILDKSTGWLYFVDNGNDRIIRLDINSATGSNTIPLINEDLAEHSSMTGFTFEVIIDAGFDQPCGIEIFENFLLVGDYANGDIIVYDIDNGFEEMGRIPTLEPGLTGIKIGPDGNIWCTNRIQNKLISIQPGAPLSTSNTENQIQINISPNPTTGLVWVNIPDLDYAQNAFIKISTATGQDIHQIEKIEANQELDLSEFSNGVYLLTIQGNDFTSTRKIVLNR